ncbi:response regulator transcription factor [Daejeonella sp. JGW-45]|uniref:response regulator transcription factor n=1 Tax=Daejeonella sp. JGW-45 TaxID=3034148 RepID=UPI0023ED8AB3|nr:response regulator transcription factor [Daejeonella sp. JGW-45]
MIEKISIVIVDDHTLFRSGVANLLSEFEEINVLFQASSGKDLQQKLSADNLPDIILMDITMPAMDGYEATKWVTGLYPQICVLALSMFDDEKSIISMLKAGACGYLLKESDPSDLLEAIKITKEKGLFINENVSGRMLVSLRHDSKAGAANLKPSQREMEFLQYCATELTYKEIADRMNVSPRTVDNYRESLFSKLNIKSRTGLVVYGIKNSLIQI